MPIIQEKTDGHLEKENEVLDKWELISNENLRKNSEYPFTTSTMSWKNIKSVDIDINSELSKAALFNFSRAQTKN